MDSNSFLERIKQLPLHEQRELLRKLQQLDESQSLDQARNQFIGYVRRMWRPEFVEGRHHREMAKIIDGIVRGELKRVCINLGPRHTKSKFGAVYGPSYYLGHHPTRKIMQLGNTQELVAGFGREVRGIVGDPEFQTLFPGVSVSSDSRAADRWNTNRGGEYFARGIGGAVTGRGADFLNIDDPHNEQEAALAAHNPKVYDHAYEWYMAGPRQRLQPGGAILLTMTRWGKRDLQGQILADAQNNGSIEEWKIFQFPVILNDKPLWPEFWSLEELLAIKRDLPIGRWNAQYMQEPTTDEGAVVKRDWWRRWDRDRLPEFIYTLQVWDTAFTAKNFSDFSACTTWGVFYHEDERTGRRIPNVMLIDAYRDRMEFPELKRRALQLKADHNPDTLLIEGRSSGQPLIQELRAMGLYVEEVQPSRATGDKLVRLNAVADIIKSGNVWYRPDRPGRMIEQVIEECAEYPSGDHDDLMDTATHALQRLRDGMLIGAASDAYQIYEDEEPHDGAGRRRSRRLY